MFNPIDPNAPKPVEKTEEQKKQEALKYVTKYYQADIKTGAVTKELQIPGKILTWI